MLRRLYSLMAILALIGPLSCIDQSDYIIDEVNLNPSIALPLLTGSLSVSDLLEEADSAHVKVYPDGLVYLAYEEDLESQDIRDLFEIPDRSTSVTFVLPGMTLPPTTQDFKSDSISRIIDFGMSPEKIDEIALRTGQIAYATVLVPNSNLDYEVKISLPTFKSASNVPLNAAVKGTGSIDLANYKLFLDDNKFQLKVTLVIKKHSSSVTIAPNTNVTVLLNFRSMQMTYMKGFLGEQTASLDASEVEMGEFGDLFEGAEISLAQPKVGLSVTNENGVPCKVNFEKLEARKDGAAPLPVALNPASPISLNFPTVMGQSAITTVNVVNVNELLQYAPTSLYYKANATINQGLTSGENFVLDTSQLQVKLNVEVPLYGHATNIRLTDTLDVELEEQKNSEVTKASLKLKIVNEMPLDGAIQLYLLNEDYDFLDELLEDDQVQILRGSKVDANGELASAGVFDGTIELSPEKLENVFKARHIIIEAVLQTSRNTSGGPQNVKFKAAHKLEIEAGVLANLKLKLK